MHQQVGKPETVALGTQPYSSLQSRLAGSLPSPVHPSPTSCSPQPGPLQASTPAGTASTVLLRETAVLALRPCLSPPAAGSRRARARLRLLRQGQTKAGVSLATDWDESFQRPPPPRPAILHAPTGRAQLGEQDRAQLPPASSPGLWVHPTHHPRLGRERLLWGC